MSLNKNQEKENTNNESQSKFSDGAIRFSDLINGIKGVMQETNNSSGYLHEFFEVTTNNTSEDLLSKKFDIIVDQMTSGDLTTAIDMLVELKSYVVADQQQVYQPKTISLEIPIYKNNIWSFDAVKIPLFALTPMLVPKIKELRFCSTLEFVEAIEGEVYVRFHESKNDVDVPNANHNSAIQVDILFSAEQSTEEVNKLIDHYEELLVSIN